MGSLRVISDRSCLYCEYGVAVSNPPETVKFFVRKGAPGSSMKQQNVFGKFMLILARTLRDTWRAKVTLCPAWRFTKLNPSAVGAEYASWQHKKNE